MSFSRVSSGGVNHPVSIRIASHGHASTHMPQKTHRSMSMSNRTGYFSTPGSGDSPATIVMHFAGHAVAQQKHATHRGDPFSRFISRCRPRNRGGISRRTSGYSIVLIPSWRTMLERRCPIVTPRPFTISTRYSASGNDISRGRATFITPIVIVPFPPLLVQKEQDQPRHEDVQQREGEHHLPPQPHHLVVPEPGNRPPDPDVKPREEKDLRDERPDPKEQDDRRRHGHRGAAGEEEPRVAQVRDLPPAEEEGRHDGRAHHHVKILGHHEHRELEGAVLGMVSGHQLRLPFGKVERGPVRLRVLGDEEEDEPERLDEDAPF